LRVIIFIELGILRTMVIGYISFKATSFSLFTRISENIRTEGVGNKKALAAGRLELLRIFDAGADKDVSNVCEWFGLVFAVVRLYRYYLAYSLHHHNTGNE
jgi:hypothetical protein